MHLQVPPEVLDDQGLLGPASPIPTPCLLLKNSECAAGVGRRAMCVWLHALGDHLAGGSPWTLDVEYQRQGSSQNFPDSLHDLVTGWCHLASS